ncbi:MAG: hypothetical protein RL562_3184 [Planctomycetota bacterium]|jgi:hypothetical protein
MPSPLPTLPTIALLLAAAAPLVAQDAVIDPAAFEHVSGSRTTGFPFGHPDRRTVRLMQIHDGLTGTPRTISSVAFRRSALDTGPVPAFLADVSLTLATAAPGRTAASIAPTFDQNLGPDATMVLPRRTLQFPSSAPPGADPAPFEYRIPTDTPFAFAGLGPLCFDLTVHDHTNPSTARFDLHAEGQSHVSSRGVGCAGLTLSTAITLPDVVHTLTGVTPGTPIALVVGGDFGSASGLPLPLSLDPLGAPGCALLVDPALGVPTVADAQGVGRIRLPVGSAPDDAFYGAQAFAFDAQLNALGLGMTGLDIVVPRTGRVVGRVFSEDLSQPDGLAQPVFGLVVELR